MPILSQLKYYTKLPNDLKNLSCNKNAQKKGPNWSALCDSSCDVFKYGL